MSAQLRLPLQREVAPSLEPTIAEMKHELDLLWRTVALYSGGKTFRAAVAKDLRGALIYQFTLWTLPAFQKRRAGIVQWLRTAELPPEVVAYDASKGHTGAEVCSDGFPLIVSGDAACCDADPDYAWDEEAIRARVRLERELLAQLLAAGWNLPNGVARLCSRCEERFR